jgi:hypothetical protein
MGPVKGFKSEGQEYPVVGGVVVLEISWAKPSAGPNQVFKSVYFQASTSDPGQPPLRIN